MARLTSMVAMGLGLIAVVALVIVFTVGEEGLVALRGQRNVDEGSMVDVQQPGSVASTSSYTGGSNNDGSSSSSNGSSSGSGGDGGSGNGGSGKGDQHNNDNDNDSGGMGQLRKQQEDGTWEWEFPPFSVEGEVTAEALRVGQAPVGTAGSDASGEGSKLHHGNGVSSWIVDDATVAALGSSDGEKNPQVLTQCTASLRYGASKQAVEDALSGMSLGLLVISASTPQSLLRSMRSWLHGGLLDMVDERVLWLNDASDVDRAIGEAFGFRVVTPLDVYQHTFRTPFPDFFHDQTKPQVYTRPMPSNTSWKFGPSFAHAMDIMSSDLVLLLEKDFALDANVDRATLMRELIIGTTYMARGNRLFRLRSRRDIGKSGFPNCCPSAKTRKCSYYASPGNTWRRQRNWFAYACPKLPRAPALKGYVSQCDDAHTRCFTSYDSNWSNNPAILNRTWLFHGLPTSNVAEVALAWSSIDNNGMFEVSMLDNDWGKWHVPICMSHQGLFVHREIDGRRL